MFRFIYLHIINVDILFETKKQNPRNSKDDKQIFDWLFHIDTLLRSNKVQDKLYPQIALTCLTQLGLVDLFPVSS